MVPIFLVMVWILFFCHGNNAPSFFFAFAVCMFLRVAFFLHLLFAFFFAFATLSEFSVAFFLHFCGLRRPRPGKMQKKGTPKSRERPKSKNTQSWKRRPAKMQKKCNPRNGGRPKRKKNAQQMQKFCDHCRNHKNLKNWQFPGAFAFFFAFVLHFFCVLAGLCFQGCICFAFWPAVASRIAFLFAFWSFSGFRCAFFFAFCRASGVSAHKNAKTMQR